MQTRDETTYWPGGSGNAHTGRLAERLDERTRYLQETARDHEERIRKVETRLNRGTIIAVLMGCGIGGNLSADTFVELAVRLLKNGF